MDDLNEVNLVEKYLKLPLTVLHVFGLWRRENNPLLYKLYSFCILFFTQYLYAVFQIIYMVNAWGDIEKIAEASFLLLTQATLCIKIAIFVAKKKKVRRLTEFINSSEVFAPSRLAHILIINVSSSVQTMEYFLFLFMTTSTIALWAIVPLIDAAPEEKVLPFKAWYPLPNDISPFYELLYFYQIGGIWFSALINVSIDRLSTSMTAVGCAEVLILRDNLINIEKYANEDLKKISNPIKYATKKEDIEKDSKIIGKRVYADPLNIDTLMDGSLTKSIFHHRNIVRFISEVEDSFHWGILAQFAASVGIICITGLQITLINPASIKFVTKITYMIAMMAQIFFICRIGNDISVLSGNLIEAAYTSPWIERKKNFNTTLLIFMERLKQPIITRAGYFFPLSLHTFMGILRSSYSYFAVLQQMNSKP